MKDFTNTPIELKLVLKSYFTILINQNIKKKIKLTNQEWDDHLENIYLRGLQLYQIYERDGDVENHIEGTSKVYICEAWVNMLSQQIKDCLMVHFKKEFRSFGEKNLTFLMHQFGYNAQYECSFLK